MKKDMQVVFRRARQQGFTLERTSGGHVKIVPPNPDLGIVFAPRTPSDWRSVRNTIADLVRIGYVHADVKRDTL